MDDLIYTRLKDGLYVGNKKVALNFQFLIANKFTHIINCTAEIKNYFQQLKYDRTKQHQRLWGESMKKLFKIIQFITEAQQKGQSCLIHSNLGDNRCFAVAIAYFMNKYSWTLNKTLEFINSKQVECKLSVNFLVQLQSLEEELRSYRVLTSKWDEVAFDNQDQMILVNTYINTLPIEYKTQKKQCRYSEKRIQWKDMLQRKSAKSRKQLMIDNKKPSRSKKHNNSVSLIKSNSIKKNKLNNDQTIFKNVRKIIEPKQIINSQSLKSLLKQKSPLIDPFHLKNKKQNHLSSKDSDTVTYKYEQSKDGQEEIESNNQSKVYKVVINNFVNPNINIITHGRRGSSPIQVQNMFSSKKPKQSSYNNKKQNLKLSKSIISQRLIKSLINLQEHKQQDVSQLFPGSKQTQQQNQPKRNRINNIKPRTKNINKSAFLELNGKKK